MTENHIKTDLPTISPRADDAADGAWRAAWLPYLSRVVISAVHADREIATATAQPPMHPGGTAVIAHLAEQAELSLAALSRGEPGGLAWCSYVYCRLVQVAREMFGQETFQGADMPALTAAETSIQTDFTGMRASTVREIPTELGEDQP